MMRSRRRSFTALGIQTLKIHPLYLYSTPYSIRYDLDNGESTEKDRVMQKKKSNCKPCTYLSWLL